MSEQLFSKFLGADPSVHRNGFDLSSRQVYTSKAGLINVPFHLATSPGMEGSIDCRHVLRTQPIQTAAFTRMDCEYRFYQVNYNDLFSGFNQWLAQREDRQLKSTPKTSNLPFFDHREALILILFYAFYDYIVDHPISTRHGVIYALGHPATSNLDSRPYYSIEDINSPYTSVALECVRMYDMFGYGNLLPVISSLYSIYRDYMDGLTDELFEQQAPPLRYPVAPVHDEKIRYMNFSTGTGDYIWIWNTLDCFSPSPGSALTIEQFLMLNFPSSDVTFWPILAYNKIFENHYRNPYYDFHFEIKSRVTQSGIPHAITSQAFDYVDLFNVDDLVGELQLTDPVNAARFLCMLCPKYAPYPKDMFTGVLPSTQFGDVSVMTDDRSWLSLISDVKPTYTNGLLHVSGESSDSAGNRRVVVGSAQTAIYPNAKFRFDPALAISVLNQRRADALQRFNEKRLRAGNRTKTIFRALFGYEPRSEQGHESYYLGSFDGRIELNNVAATSPSDGVELGQLGANGVGVVSGSKIHFQTSDFGVILGLFHISKPSEYDAYGVDRHWCLLDPFDFPYTDLQNISLAPLDSYQLNAALGHKNLGFLPRFIERKTAVDQVHGEFFSSPIFWYYDSYLQAANIRQRQGVFSNFVTPRFDYAFADGVSWLYVEPNSVDNIFSTLANGSQDTDQFLINCQFDVFTTQNLSVLGLPY